jgi:hypothetical protein
MDEIDPCNYSGHQTGKYEKLPKATANGLFEKKY